MFSQFLFRSFLRDMIFFERYVFIFFLFFFQNGVRAGDSGLVINKSIYNNDFDRKFDFNKSSTSQIGDDIKWKNLEEEVFQELSLLNFRKQREIFEDLKKQQQEMNTSHKNLTFFERQSLSPLNVEELKNIRKAIKSSNNTLPTIRNKRTLNLLLFVVAKAMGFSLIPRSYNVLWSPATNSPSLAPPSPPCSSTPSCKSNPPSPSPSPCPQSTTVPSCLRLSTSTQPPTIPPNQIDANTISYPFRPAGTIPLFNFAPLPVGVTVPYPPLLQPPTRQPPPCARAQPPSMPRCGGTSQPSTPPPCPAMPSTPPCGMTATPSSQPCGATAAPRPPCATPPVPKSPPPCPASSSQAPCGTSSPSPSSPPPCAFPTSQSPPPVLSSTEKAPKNSIFLEYDNPVRIHIFSNEKKYLPASGSIYRGQEDDYEENTHSYFFPSNEENKDKNKSGEGEEEKEEKEEEEEREEIEDKPMRVQDDEKEENEATEEEDRRSRKWEYPEIKYGQWGFHENSQKEEENDSDDHESETNLSLVKKPIGQQVQRQRRISLKQSNSLPKNISLGTKNYEDEDTLTEEKMFEETGRVKSIKRPKNNKWVRIVKKQRRKSKMDSHPQENFHVFYTSNTSPKTSFASHNIFSRSATEHGSQYGFHKDFIDSMNENIKNISLTGLEKINFKKEGSESVKSLKRVRRYKENRPKYYETETEDEKRKKLEKAVERYIEDYIEKQLGQEIIKNTGIPKTTVFEFVPKNGPRIQTITTTVAKTNHHGPQLNSNSQVTPEKSSGSDNFHLIEETDKFSSRKYSF